MGSFPKIPIFEEHPEKKPGKTKKDKGKKFPEIFRKGKLKKKGHFFPEPNPEKFHAKREK